MTEPANNPTSSRNTPASTPPTATTTGAAPPPADAPRRRGVVGRIIKWTFVILLLLVVGGGAWLWMNLNHLVKQTVESQGTSQLKLKTELDNAKISLFGGSLNLNDLKIGSPQGFQAPQMFRLTNADVNVKLGELRGDPVRVHSITLDKPKLVIERLGDKFNFKAAMDMMPKQPEAPPEQKEPLKLIIDELTIKDPTVVIRPGHINIPGVNLPEELTITIPTMAMKNIGSGPGAENGAAVKDVVMQVITAMAAQAANSGQLPDQLKNLLNVDVKQVVAGLTAEAQKKIVEAIPGEAGKMLSDVIADPNALIKNPSAVLGTQADKVRDQAQQEAQKRIGGLVGNITGGNPSTQPSTQPASQPADRIKQEAQKQVEKGLGDLLNRGKKK